MMRNGVGSKVAVKMFLNAICDAIIGTIPFIGQVLDFFYKGNKKNVQLLREHYFEGKHQGSATGLLVGILVFLLIIIFAIFYLIWISASWIFSFMESIF